MAEQGEKLQALAAQNEALRSALFAIRDDKYGLWEDQLRTCNNALNLPNLAESVLKRRDAEILRNAACRIAFLENLVAKYESDD